jgi:hypothetical protein
MDGLPSKFDHPCVPLPSTLLGMRVRVRIRDKVRVRVRVRVRV